MILHRQPSAGGKTAVDIAYQPVNAIFELVISWDLESARQHNLNQDHAARQFRITVS